MIRKLKDDPYPPQTQSSGLELTDLRVRLFRPVAFRK